MTAMYSDNNNHNTTAVVKVNKQKIFINFIFTMYTII